MENALRKLEEYIAGMTPADRLVAVKAINELIAVLSKYRIPLTAGMVLSVASSAGVAHAAGTVDKWWARLCQKAQSVGPHVGAIFQARQA
jgi:hypothetical protein